MTDIVGTTPIGEGRAVAEARPRDALGPLAILFFMSGFPALIYQLIWQRALFRIFGVNIESVTIIVTAFMIGLGLGSLAGGFLSTRPRLKLLPLLAAIEGLTGLFGFVSLAIFDRVGMATLGLALPIMALVTLALVLVPTLLMGATLPVLVGHLARLSGNTGRSVGYLYYVNTLGAGAACLVGATLVFPFFGMQASIYFAVALNILVASGALAIHWRGGGHSAFAEMFDPVASAAEVAARDDPPALSLPVVLGLAALGGFASLSYEIFFFRVQSFATGSSASAFAETLGAFLIGIASGARDAGRLAGTAGGVPTRIVVARLMVSCGAGLLYLPLLDATASLPTMSAALSLLLVYVIARSWGMVFPTLAHLGVRPDGRAGVKVAWLYLANIFGSATGSILTGFVLMDELTLVEIGEVLVIVSLGATLLLTFALPAARQRQGVAASAFLLAAAGVFALPQLTPNLLERLQFKNDPAANVPFARIIENRSGIIAVDSKGGVWGHGMYDGRINTDLTDDVNGIRRPYALSLFHPAPRQVLMIGLASGSWARVLASNPDVEHLTVVEINPAYRDIVGDAPQVQSVLGDPKVEIIVDDGRRWLLAHPEAQFDAVVSNTTWYYRANITNLLSSEFLRLVAAHLRPGGIFFWNTTDSARAQKTACLGFAHALRFDNAMVASEAPIALDFSRWRASLLGYRIDGHRVLDLARGKDVAMLDRLMSLEGSEAAAGGAGQGLESCSSILARTSGLMPISDDNMGSEWRHPLGFD
jgi:spermidine synthase